MVLFYNSTLILNKLVADIGAGTGRITNILVSSGAKRVYAIEPSSSFEVLIENTKSKSAQIEYVNCAGDEISESIRVDLVFSIGVLHHIPNPGAVIDKTYSILNEGGKIVIWLYGREGNLIYLCLANLLRKITTQISHENLLKISRLLIFPLKVYGFISNYLPLPMRNYMIGHVNKLDNEAMLITIYDQLNPNYSKYYTRQEAITLLESGGFKNV